MRSQKATRVPGDYIQEIHRSRDWFQVEESSLANAIINIPGRSPAPKSAWKLLRSIIIPEQRANRVKLVGRYHTISRIATANRELKGTWKT